MGGGGWVKTCRGKGGRELVKRGWGVRLAESQNKF